MENLRTQQLMNCLQELILMHCQYIFYVHFLRYPLHEHFLLMGQQMNLHHHHMTHHQKEWHLKEILRHATSQPIRYQTYQTNWIQIQVCQILLGRIHLTHQTTITLNKYDIRKIIKINSGVKCVPMALSKSAQSLQTSYLQSRTNLR